MRAGLRPGPVDEQAKAVIASYPAKMSKLRSQLTALEAGTDPLLTELKAAEQQRSALFTPHGVRAQSGRGPRLQAAQARWAKAAAQLKEAAPWLLA